MDEAAKRTERTGREFPRATPGEAAPSFWAAASPPALPFPPLAGEAQADLVVVGGGFSGLSTALHAAERGASVVLLEGREIGFGASGRNNGQVIPTLSKLDPDDMVRRYGGEPGERFAALVRDSAGIVFDVIRRHGLACDGEQTGWLQPVHTPGRLRIAERRYEQWSRLGADVELLDAAEMEARLGSPRFFGGIAMATGGHINPLALARELARAAAGLGVRIHTGSPAGAMRREGERWRVETPGGHVLAGRLVVATNAYGTGAGRPLAQTLIPVTSWQAATAPLSANVRASILPGRSAASDTHGDLRFFRPTADGRLVTGGALMLKADGEARIARQVRRRLAETFPQIGDVAVTHVWNGTIGMTPDHAPRVVDLGPGAYGWAGCNGRGVALSIALGRELARLLAGEDRATLALPFEAPAAIPFRALAAGVAPFMLARYRWRDARELR